MTEIIPGLQGEPPAKYRRGFHMLVEGIALENVEFSSNQEKSYDV